MTTKPEMQKIRKESYTQKKKINTTRKIQERINSARHVDKI
jgi:hypothetical protein